MANYVVYLSSGLRIAGGFGNGPWGRDPWGAFTVGGDASEAVQFSDNLLVTFYLRVLGAVSPSSETVLVTFAHPLDPFYAPNFDPSNYTIFGLTVTAVAFGPTQNTVLLTTSEQGPITYTVVVADAKDTTGDTLDPLHDSAVFAGTPVEPTFFAAAQSATRVELVFSTAMLQNAAYTETLSYSITDMNGASVPVMLVTPVGPTPNRRVVLDLSTPLTPGGYYAITLGPEVQTTFYMEIYPNTDLFQWNQAPRPRGETRFTIPISSFSGEVSGGILGEPLGLVFFSPSLEVAAPNSAIQVDSVEVCTLAYDEYHPPSPPDPGPLYTVGKGPGGTTWAPGPAMPSVLWAPFDRLTGARLDLLHSVADALGPYTDGPAVAILAQPFDPAYVSLLNNPFWTMFNGSGTPFITANNLAPIPSGPTVVITLQGVAESFSAESFGGDPWGGEDWG